MKECVVTADKLALTVLKGSVVFVDEQQYEAAKSLLKVKEEKKKVKNDNK